MNTSVPVKQIPPSTYFREIPGRPFVTASVLIAVISAVYAPTLPHPFVFDDIPELVQNPDILRLAGCSDTISRSPNTGLSGRPFACLSFAANVQVGGLSVRGFHVVNILIHIVAALALYGIVRRTLVRSFSLRFDFVQASIFAGLIAAVWALHPLQTESVTYIVQRIESLAGMWYLLTLYCSIRSLDTRHTVLWQLAALVCCTLGMLTKEIVATAPLIVVLHDWVLGVQPPLSRRKWFYVGLASTWIIPAFLISQGPRGASAGFGLGVSALDYLRTQAGVILHYVRLCFWPFPQAISYSDWPVVRQWGAAIVPGLVILALLALTIAGLVRRKWWGLCGAWFFLILAPSSSIIPIVTEPAAERRMYLPLAAVIVCVAMILFRLTDPWNHSVRVRIAAGLTGLAVLCAAGGVTLARNEDYSSEVKILSSTLEARPGDELIRGALVEALVNQGDVEEARKTYEQGIALNADSYILRDNWARALASVGRHSQAVALFHEAIRLRPDHHPTKAALGVSLLELGKPAEAQLQLEEALRLHPHSYTIRGNLAIAMAQQSRIDAAIEQLQQAVRLKPSFANGHYNLGRLLIQQKNWQAAIVHLREAAALQPDDAQISEALAVAIQQAGQANAP